MLFCEFRPSVQGRVARALPCSMEGSAAPVPRVEPLPTKRNRVLSNTKNFMAPMLGYSVGKLPCATIREIWKTEALTDRYLGLNCWDSLKTWIPHRRRDWETRRLIGRVFWRSLVGVQSV
uniref:Uncharacterized protein n=1 Tax=Nuksystermes virus TaxID=2796622 RepID=A0A894KQP9_9VIRU|nr:hypothetical protein 4 [Nuksystermes virus]QRW42902.1 hypothetical protein 4 [Nuksystermes virus]